MLLHAPWATAGPGDRVKIKQAQTLPSWNTQPILATSEVQKVKSMLMGN